MIQAQFDKTFAGWRETARTFLLQGIPPEAIQWSDETLSLFANEPAVATVPLKPLLVPAEFLKISEAVAYARDEDRWSLLYRILYRLQFENPALMNVVVDPDILRANELCKSVRRDIHKMHAFVRFKQEQIDGHEVYVAWHRSEHLTIRPGAPFFARRFGDRRWSIWTADESAHWDLEKITFAPGMEQHEFQTKDNWDNVWKTYYQAIFNPARIKIKMMKQEMAPKYWPSMPETALIKELVRGSPERLQTFVRTQRQAAKPGGSSSLMDLARESRSCTACPLAQNATQTVFGMGPGDASLMIVGEQPGDTEDLNGQPFVGPSGDVLNEALKRLNIDRSKLYLTNAVKHFKFQREGKARIHKKPSGTEMHACKPWLDAEIARVKPKVIVALGTTAATSVVGRLPRLSEERGQLMNERRSLVMLSWHPAAILRAPSEAEGRERFEQLVNDLRIAFEASTFQSPHKEQRRANSDEVWAPSRENRR